MVNLADIYMAERTIYQTGGGIYESWFSMSWGTLYLTVAYNNMTGRLNWDYGLEPDEVFAIEGVIAEHLLTNKQ